MNYLQLLLCIIATLMGVYAYGNNAWQIFKGEMVTSFWGRLVWLGTNTVILLALFGGNASPLTIVPMFVNVVFLVIIQIACCYKKLFMISKVDVLCLIIVAISLTIYLFSNETVGLLLTLVADTIGGTLVILAMFKNAKKGARTGKSPSQYVLSGVRNVMMLFANSAPPTFLSVFGLAYQTFEAVVLTLCAHIIKTGRINRNKQYEQESVE